MHASNNQCCIDDFIHVGDMTIFRGKYDEEKLQNEEEKENKRQKRHVINNSFGKWPGGVIPYEIASQFSGEIIINNRSLNCIQSHD